MGSLSRAGSAPWAALPLGAKLFRIAHFVWGGFNMAALGYVWFSAATRRRDRCLSASVGLLGSEGVALVVGRGNCPFGPFQRSLGDPVPMFELMLPPRAAKAAVPALAVVTLLGFVAAWLRPPAPASSVSADARPGDRQPHYSLPRELLALGIVGHWAFTRGADGVTGVLFAIVAMLVAVVIWGLFLAPRSRLLRRLSRERKDFLATLVLLAAALLLASAGHSSPAVMYAVAVVVNAALLFLVRGESEQFLKGLGPGPRRQRR